MQIKDICSKYKDIIPYAIFGVLTTIINIVVYYVMAHFVLNYIASKLLIFKRKE